MVDHWPISTVLSEDEQKMIADYRKEKDMIVNEQNEKSPNQRAVEDIERLKTHLDLNGVTFNKNSPVDNAIMCLMHRLQIIKETRIELDNKQTVSYMNEYQNKAAETAIYPGKGTPLGLIYCALKLCGEAGEVSENVGKALRDDGLMDNPTYPNYPEIMNDDRIRKIKLELGDVLWYISQAAKELGFTLEEIAEENFSKLASRQEKGTLKGSGDDR